MKPFILSLGAGLLVGILYALMRVRSPAPPAIALIGLLGILIGEQLPSLVRSLIGPAHVTQPAQQDRKPSGPGDVHND